MFAPKGMMLHQNQEEFAGNCGDFTRKTLDLPHQYDATDMLINMNGDQMVDESYTLRSEAIINALETNMTGTSHPSHRP